MSIDVAFPADRNVIKKEAKKILKYKDLPIEIIAYRMRKQIDIDSNRKDLNHL